MGYKDCGCSKGKTSCSCPIKDLGTECVTYKGNSLVNLNLPTNTTLNVIIEKIDSLIPLLKTLMIYKGEYDSMVTYNKGDVVDYNGEEYYSLVGGNTNLPDTPLWDKVPFVIN